MPRKARPLGSRFALLLLVSSALAGCGSEEAALAPPDPCDRPLPAGFSIPNPESGRVYVWGGTGLAGAGDMGLAPGFTRLYWPVEVDFDPAGNPIVLDWNNHRVLALDGSRRFVKLIGRNFGNPQDGLATEIDLNHPTHVTFSPNGAKLVLSAWHNSIVMEMDLSTQWIARYCGTGGRCFNGDGQNRLDSCLDLPVVSLYSPLDGDLYIGDQANHVIRRIDATGAVHVVAGSMPVWNGTIWVHQFGYAGDGGPATSARLHFERGQQANPSGRFCFDGDGNIYIADTKNHAIRFVSALDQSIHTIAGLGPTEPGHSGDGGPASQARLYEPRDVAVDGDGTLFIADTGNHVIRKVAPDGTISTAVGVVRSYQATAIALCELHGEQGAPARSVRLSAPYGIELDHDGNLWIADTQNNVIRILYR